ncbi:MULTISPECIES: maleylpyruvate isomerase N-terminal domain-containing protein [Streptomyces]|uniref:Maleylpyruvate isomerase n=1 Tax=Streptomyces spororaveus TaxID=284039 RepID=A0ABQ3T483_9ACTN|nr:MULTISPECIES: maleylpyruvate isomerase N-terminal domain-containing protein [Streptomyces]MCM9077301.1 maleylpyruvate isomerase N-terminal domain-containing protein [Streptomyces spororaveus]MCX5309299.1 maleylpyruvate isomerase N-terminal domain-containing protein [Streptomyces sp. NBC_00160]GHI74805.1 maleylpyruvate isomerase [Streptomyces spororaveus]
MIGTEPPQGQDPPPQAVRAGPVRALHASYQALAAVVAPLEDEDSWQPTGCTGWAVRDLLFHCLMDCQRGLVALHTPAPGPADRDAVTYWSDRRPDREGAANGRRWARVSAGMFLHFGQLRGLYLETAAATLNAAAATDPGLLLSTQGHTMTAGDLMKTLTAEATVHHLDLVASLPHAPGASPPGLACVRATLDGLLGRPLPLDWSDEHYARAGTGRLPLTNAEERALGPDAASFPLFG